jgi:hypothetical protein
VRFVSILAQLRSAVVVSCVGLVWAVCPAIASSATGERGFERVSPQAKGADIEIGGVSRVAPDGDVVAFMSFGDLAEGVSRVYLNEFRSSRIHGKWSTISMNPPFDPYPGIAISEFFQAVSPDVNIGVAKSWGSQEFGHPQLYNLWRFDALGGRFDLVSTPLGEMPSPEVPPGGASAGSNFAGASDDFSHIVFDASRRLIQEAPGDANSIGAYLYEWSDGELRYVPVFPDAQGGGPLLGSVLGYGNPSDLFYPGQFAVSADGSRIFFSTSITPSTPERDIFVRKADSAIVGGRTSVHVSASERTDCAGDPTCGGDGVPDPTPDPNSSNAALFQLATRDSGGVALFSSPARLTDQATASISGGIGGLYGGDSCAFGRCDLYRWDPTMPAGERLTDLTSGDPDGGGVLSVVGGSDDASYVYFVATGVLDVGAVDGQPNLYLWQQGQGVRYIAALDGSDRGGRAGDRGVWSRRTSLNDADGTGSDSFGGGFRVTTDGRIAVFRSRARVTAYDNAGKYQVYRYEAANGSLVCASCSQRVNAAGGDAFLKREGEATARPPWLSRNLAEDGRRVIFDSAEALVPSDTNGKVDVYEWSDGQVRLISSGKDSENSAFLDASESGDDVFFTTRARLISSDEDNLVDLYDARMGGGDPGPSTKPTCQGEVCRGAPPIPPVFPQLGTTVQGEGNGGPAPPRAHKGRCRKHFVKKRVRGKVRCVKKSARKPARRGANRRRV